MSSNQKNSSVSQSKAGTKHEPTNDASSDISFSFDNNSELDPRLLRALSKLKYVKPTLIQEKAIPLALAGKDILARARTGSGKTAAYSLPVIQKILTAKATSKLTSIHGSTRALILVPTRELAQQVTKHINELLIYCSKDIKVVNIGTNTPVELQKPLLLEAPDIVVSTPFRAVAQLEAQNLVVRESLQTLVIDEADLILSYGYEEDMQKLLTFLPKFFQSLIMSATLSKDVEKLKHWILRNPVTLKLEEEKDELDLLAQYCVLCSEVDKFLLIFVILRLRLIKGKCLIFVNDIDRCYRLKLFLEQFSIKSCVLNSELPLNSRYHIVEEFNKGVYEYIIATDENNLKGEKDSDDELDNNDYATDNDEASKMEQSQESNPKKKKKSRKNKQDKEYGVSRGIDFVNVAAVINFDFPTSAKSYTHRIGRTARANQKGMSLSFVVPKKLAGKNKNVSCPTTENDEVLYARVEKQQLEAGRTIKPYTFDMKQVEGFRYRVEDALRVVTRIAIREARLKEVKQEIINSEKLKSHFEDHPKDLNFLRHDKPLHPTRVQTHLKDIPTYLMPRIKTLRVPDTTTEGTSSNVGYVPYHKTSTNRYRKHKGPKFAGQKRKNDPLKTYKTKNEEKRKKQKRS
ncbi:3916_t:CDS:10 [Ambispora leptoticha]|uniref:RNA helicase n=1 Tax=Ambispora leptoticha TaxID=144679 RepID=A0A9N8WC89_9GLOM|nr:3916_t:CDS:10 [Ambispora leptoticha]